MKLLKAIKIIPGIIKSCFFMTRSEWLQSRGRDEDALKALIKIKNQSEGKDHAFHLNLGKLSFNIDKDSLKSISELKKAIPLIEKDKKIDEDERQYLLSYSKYLIAVGLAELGEEEKAEHWRTECEKHHFDGDKVSKGTRGIFPMRWHVDYKS